MDRTAFTKIESWAVPKSAGVLSLFETIALSDLENKEIRFSAETQRAIIGFPVFGKRLFRVNSDGSVTVFISIAFGQDSEQRTYSAREVDYARQNKLALLPYTEGPGVFTHIPETQEVQ